MVYNSSGSDTAFSSFLPSLCCLVELVLNEKEESTPTVTRYFQTPTLADEKDYREALEACIISQLQSCFVAEFTKHYEQGFRTGN